MKAHSATEAAAASLTSKTVPRTIGVVALLSVLVLWACLAQPLNLSALGSDGGQDGASSTSDGNAALIGQFTIGGCAELSFPAGEVNCVGTAPLKLTLVLIQVGATTYRWKLVPQKDLVDGGTSSDAGASADGGTTEVSLLDEAASRAASPSVTIDKPGTYQVTLGVAGPGGTATAAGLIQVLPASLGGVCTADTQCALGLRCLCGAGTPGRDGTCPGGLGAGLCTRSCDGSSCPSGIVCLDLSRTKGTGMDGGAGDTWRTPICVPSCASGQPCRADLTCRELPTLSAGGHAGDAYVFRAGCFLSTPGAVGDSCLGSEGQLDATACATGVCEPLGLRNLCSAGCSAGCPTDAACATWNSLLSPAPSGPRCLARCDVMNPCTDPLLACIAGGGLGPLGFALQGEPLTATVCAPRSCTLPVDCPGGRCAVFGGGSFCLHN